MQKVQVLPLRIQARLPLSPLTVIEVLHDPDLDLDPELFVWLQVRTVTGNETIFWSGWFNKT